METENIGALSAINLLPSTNQQAQSFSNMIIEQVKSGTVNPLELKAQLKFIEKTLELIDKGVKESWMKEAAKYGKSFEFKGWKIEEMEAGTRYDFSSDPVHEALVKELKEREAFLKVLKEPITVVDESTGEVVKVSPPTKKSTTTLKFSAI